MRILLARLTSDAFHLVTQVDTNIVLSLLLQSNVKKDRTTFVSTCVIKWKTPITISFRNNIYRINFCFLSVSPTRCACAALFAPIMRDLTNRFYISDISVSFDNYCTFMLLYDCYMILTDMHVLFYILEANHVFSL